MNIKLIIFDFDGTIMDTKNTIIILIIPILSYLVERIMSWMGYDGKQ